MIEFNNIFGGNKVPRDVVATCRWHDVLVTDFSFDNVRELKRGDRDGTRFMYVGSTQGLLGHGVLLKTT